MEKIVIIDYGAGNTRSVQFALERLGVEAVLTNNHTQIQAADKVIFPGVGQAQTAMLNLQSTGLDQLIPTLKQPVLGVCLGMQLLCDFSEEANTDCLGIFPLQVKRFPKIMRVPHIGWNQIITLESSIFNKIPDKEYMYYVHSYFVELSEYTIATTNYGLSFSAAIQKDNFYGCQFHPEKSGSMGERILANFLKIN